MSQSHSDTADVKLDPEPDLDSPRVAQFPLVAVLGDTPTATVINTLVTREQALSIADLEDTTGYTRAELRTAIDKLRIVNAIVEPKPGTYAVDHSSTVMQSLAAAERELAAKLYPDSYFASIVKQER